MPWVVYEPQLVFLVRQSRALLVSEDGTWPLPAFGVAGMPMAIWSGRRGGKTLLASPATGKPVRSMSVMAMWKSAPPMEWYWLSRPMIGPEL